MKTDWLRTAIAVVGPALLLAGLYRLALGYRSDYLGHFLAGYGGTLGVSTLVLAAASRRASRQTLIWMIAVACVICVAIGAVLEATIFRIAIFDRVDLGNQSLGAVLAGLATLAGCCPGQSSIGASATSLIAAGLSLAAGFFFAFA